MKRKLLVICALVALLFTACPTGGDDDVPSKEPTQEKPTPEPTRHTVTFKAGEGSGAAPAQQKVTAGTAITLPEQGSMSAPEGKTFDGWETGDHAYAAKASFTVTKDTEFIAQWRSVIAPGNTYVEFENMEQFPAIIYADALRQTEIARVPAEGKKLIETEPKPQGTAFYPRFLLEFEGIPLAYNGSAIMIRVDEKQVNKANIPALTTIETGFAYIKIENAGIDSLTFNQGSYELAPLGEASSIIMPGETGAYQIAPGAANLYKVMKNGSIPLDFPAQATLFEAEKLYVFAYDGNALALSDSMEVLQALTMLSTPRSVGATVESASSIILTWAAVENATSYKIYRSSSPDAGFALAGTVSGLSYTDKNLSVGTNYYKVKALNDKRESPLSAGFAIQILPTPQQAAVHVESASSITLTWAAVAGAGEYKVYRSTSPDTGFEVVGTASGLSYTDENLSAETTYFYKIQAVNTGTAGASVLSAEVSARILPAPQLSAQVESASSISLTWTTVEGASSYNLYRSTSPDAGFAVVGTVSGLSYTDKNLSAETTYYYKIQAVNSTGGGLLSERLAINILPTPQQVQAQAATSEASITLSWAAATGATSYQVYRSTSSDTGFAVVGTVSGLSYTDGNLSWETVYYYKIQGVNTVGADASPLSALVSATTPTAPLPPDYYRVATTDEMSAAIQAVNNVNYSAFTIALTGSFSLDSVSLSRNGTSTVLTIKSESAGEKTLSLSSLSIGSGVSLVLEAQVTLDGLDTGNRLVQIASGGNFTMKAGSKVHGNTGGGVYVSGGAFAMYGGEISGNSTSSYGGGVYVEGGSFTMSGGAISGNSAHSRGGGVDVSSNATFTMSNGKISGNTVSGTHRPLGGGVYVHSSATFTMSGGEISGNSTPSGSGGGVYVRNTGTFTMSGGAISGNSSSGSAGRGGGVYAVSTGTFIKQSGGIIYGSNASSTLKNTTGGGDEHGHAVFVSLKKKRNSTAGNGVVLDSSKDGSAGGWE